MDKNKTTYDIELGPNPFDEWNREQIEGHKAQYIDAIQRGELQLEASLKDILLQAGLSSFDITELQIEATKLSTRIKWYISDHIHQHVVHETTRYDEVFELLDSNIHVPFVMHRKGAKKKSNVEEKPSVDIRTTWNVSEPVRKHVVAEVLQHQHPAGLQLVHLPKSVIIHYSKGKTTLCGKKWTTPVLPEHASDPLYEVCRKCKEKAI